MRPPAHPDSDRPAAREPGRSGPAEREPAAPEPAEPELADIVPASAVRARIWRAVYGPEYPAQADPFSYVSRTELGCFRRELRVGQGQHLVDVGCGKGGPGLWLASVTGARLTGIDVAQAALTIARDRAARLGLAGRAGRAGRASFCQGSFGDTGLADRSADAVMSVDALLFAPDKPAAAAELARIIVPSGRLVLTSWDYHRQPAGRPPQVADHRPLLERAGFDLVRYAETDAWRERQERTGRALLAAADELAAESGERPEAVRARIAEMNAALACVLRRVLIIARRSRVRPGRTG